MRLSFSPINARYASERNMPQTVMKYTASRRSITPRAISRKCEITPNRPTMALRAGGSPTNTGSRPIKINRNITATPIMNAVI